MALTQVKTSGIAADAVTGAKVADDQIDSEHYIAASIDNEHLADNAVDTDEIADDAVTADKLANSINTEIAANTAKVTNATHTGEVTGATALTIADNAVTLAKMDDLARGRLIVGDASGNPSSLPAGSDNHVLTMDANGDCGWEAAAASGAALTGSTDNTVVTVTGADAMQGEANLQFDGSSLGIGVAAGTRLLHAKEGTQNRVVRVESTGTSGAMVVFVDSNTTDDSKVRVGCSGGDNILLRGQVQSFQNAAGTEVAQIDTNGNLKINDGDLVIGTAGKGIDFSNQTATSATGGTATSELLDHYEEGTWTPVFSASGTDPTYTNWHTTGTYIRVGGVCHIWYDPNNITFSGTDSSGYGEILGFPFASTDNGSMACGRCDDILKWGGVGNRGDRGFTIYASGAGGRFNTDAPSTGFTWDNGNASNKGYFDMGGSYKCV